MKTVFRPPLMVIFDLALSAAIAVAAIRVSAPKPSRVRAIIVPFIIVLLRLSSINRSRLKSGAVALNWWPPASPVAATAPTRFEKHAFEERRRLYTHPALRGSDVANRSTLTRGRTKLARGRIPPCSENHLRSY